MRYMNNSDYQEFNGKQSLYVVHPSEEDGDFCADYFPIGLWGGNGYELRRKTPFSRDEPAAVERHLILKKK